MTSLHTNSGGMLATRSFKKVLKARAASIASLLHSRSMGKTTGGLKKQCPEEGGESNSEHRAVDMAMFVRALKLLKMVQPCVHMLKGRNEKCSISFGLVLAFGKKGRKRGV